MGSSASSLLFLLFLLAPHVRGECEQSSAVTALLATVKNLTDCVLKNSLPTRFCAVCTADKSAFDAAFDALSDDCQSFSVFAGWYSWIDTVWTNSHCADCSLQDMQHFIQLVCTAEQCLANTSACPSSLGPHGSGDTATALAGPASPQLCSACAAAVQHVTDAFNGFSSGCRRNTDIGDQLHRFQSFLDTASCPGVEEKSSAIILPIVTSAVPALIFYWSVYLLYVFYRREAPRSLRTASFSGVRPPAQQQAEASERYGLDVAASPTQPLLPPSRTPSFSRGGRHQRSRSMWSRHSGPSAFPASDGEAELGNAPTTVQ